MKKNQPAFVLGVLGLFTGSLAFAQNYQTMPVQSGFNEDVIANGVGTSLSSTTSILDGDSYVFVAKNFQATATSPTITYGIPTDGIINSVVTSTPGLSYQLGNLSAANSLRLSNANLTGTMVFTTPKAATKLYMLSTSGSAASTLTVTVNFTDATSQVITGNAVPDWYGGSDFAIQGLGRINRTTDGLDAAGGTNPRLYQAVLNIDVANQAKPIQSVTITKTSTTNGFPNVFAFSADVYSTCAPPVLQPATNITANGATLNWTASPSAQASTYDVYYSTTSTAPTSSTSPILSNLSGITTPVGSLQANTTYYYWVRTNCGGTTAQSVWSFSGTFKTACGAMTSVSENFDSYNTGTTFPDCWVRLVGTTGTLSISSTTPASGSRNIYQYSTSSQNTSVAVLPELSNVNAGTHWLRLKARVSSTSGTLNVGYVTNPTDASTFVLLQALTISNVNYTTSDPEYKIIVPSTVPANARLAVKNTADGKGYYWDDVIWEAIPSCMQPTGLAVSTVTGNSVTINWVAPNPAPVNGYEYYYSTTNTAPTATTAALGTVAAGITSTTIPSLTSNTNYYVWVRSVCASGKSEWSFQATFKTLCMPMTSLFENFDSYGTGDIVPDCWARLAGTGSQTITTTSPASGSRNIYQYTTSSATPTLVVLPIFSNINSGSYRLRFKARTTSTAGGTLNVGYVTDASDASTFVLLEGLSITNTTYTATNAEYIVTIPATVPATARLAIHSIKDGKSYYWDDVYWEDANLSTSEINAKKKLSIYPNPFNNVLFISETENVKTVKVNDVAGRTLKVIENPTKEINLSSLNSGLYLITLYFKDGSQNTVKAIKK